LDHERPAILWECHSGFAGYHLGGNATAQKVLQEGLWWHTIFKDAKEFTRGCDAFQWVSKPSHIGEFPLHLVRALQDFEKWVFYFIVPINQMVKHYKETYIITSTNYLTHWAKEEPVKYFSTITTTRFIFEKNIN
jgi:hypothetical protein